MFPISIQSHFFVELYAMGVPVLLPSVSFLLELDVMTDWRIASSCHSSSSSSIHSDFGRHHSFSQHRGNIHTSTSKEPHEELNRGNVVGNHLDNQPIVTRYTRSMHPLSEVHVDPESYSTNDRHYWLNQTAYYMWPHVLQFNSFDEMFVLLNKTDWTVVHSNMMQENKRRFQDSR